MEYYVKWNAIKRNTLLIQTTALVNLRIIVLSKSSQKRARDDFAIMFSWLVCTIYPRIFLSCMFLVRVGHQGDLFEILRGYRKATL